MTHVLKSDPSIQWAARTGRQFVVGFMFTKDGNKVRMIEKQHPEWQKGKLNGIGGKIEPGEEPIAAMVREFEEETGWRTFESDWTHFAILQGSCAERPEETAVMHCFTARDDAAYRGCRTVTDE